MIILSFKVVQAFVFEHPESAEALNRWFKLTRAASWKQFSEIKKILDRSMPLETIGLFLIFMAMLLDWLH